MSIFNPRRYSPTQRNHFQLSSDPEDRAVDIYTIDMVRKYLESGFIDEALNQFGKALGTKISQQELGLHSRAKHVESNRDPKAVIDRIIQQTYPDNPQHCGRIRG